MRQPFSPSPALWETASKRLVSIPPFNAQFPYPAGLSLVIGGQSHTFLYSGTPPKLNTVTNTSDVTPYPYPINVQNQFGTTVPYVQAFWGGR